MRFLAATTAALLALVASPSSARAQLRQPDGTVIPTPTSSDGPSVGDILTMRGETNLTAPRTPFDAQSNARADPQTFRPGCRISFTVVARYAGDESAFGWYNAVPGRTTPPPEAERYDIVPNAGMADPAASGGPGFVGTLDIGTDPRYAGGDIGFYLHNTVQDHFVYTERRYQPSDVPGFIYALVYDSRATPNAFYFAWEDAIDGNDDDFNDLMVQVGNLVCTGGGGPCTVPDAMGACAVGTQQCRNAELTCVATTPPSAERCDGVDNDCNGTVDDGSGLCPPRQVCDRGQCVESCSAELGCLSGFVCSDRGSCVETACATVTCAPGQVCRRGTCHAACEGVVCPHGQVCRLDRCVDLCAGLRCDSDQVCVAGLCQTRCPCRRCAATEQCMSDGACRPLECATVTCAAGTYCMAGRCLDACAGVVCPGGLRCALGACPSPIADAGVAMDAAVPGDAGSSVAVDAGSVVVTDTGSTVGSRRDAGPGMIDGGRGAELVASDGCGCRAGGGGGSRGGLAALLVAALAGVTRRSRGGCTRRGFQGSRSARRSSPRR